MPRPSAHNTKTLRKPTRDRVAEAENSEQLQQVIAEQSGVDDTTAASPLIVIPSNVDAQIDLCTHYGIYTNLRLNSLAAELIARDRCLQIKDMKAETDAGSMNLTALYATAAGTTSSPGSTWN